MKLFVKLILAGLYALGLALPILVFFSVRGGLSSLAGIELKQLISLLYPLFGLYAFTLVAMQVLIGSNMRKLRTIFPAIMNFHRYQGLAAFGLVLIHPTLVLISFGLKKVIRFEVTAPDNRIYLLFGELALVLISVTVITAFLAWKFGRATSFWRKLHLLNYLAFALAWIHSWFMGSDVQPTALRWLWLSYGCLAAGSLVLRLFRPSRGLLQATNLPPSQS